MSWDTRPIEQGGQRWSYLHTRQYRVKCNSFLDKNNRKRITYLPEYKDVFFWHPLSISWDRGGVPYSKWQEIDGYMWLIDPEAALQIIKQDKERRANEDKIKPKTWYWYPE